MRILLRPLRLQRRCGAEGRRDEPERPLHQRFGFRRRVVRRLLLRLGPQQLGIGQFEFVGRDHAIPGLESGYRIFVHFCLHDAVWRR
jgi:hypothetical protein